MSRLTTQQRKLIYLGAIVVLLIPIFLLGMPATTEDEGGSLAQLRQEYDLGETSLGDVDPTSATMNLVLLGMRGVATNFLWREMDEQKTTKQWAQMRATTESIIKLQPHYLEVWRYHGWNLSFNVSAEWDGVSDRYYWVKEGAKFTMRGSNRNRKYPELYWDVGNTLGKKVGRSDEAAFFRKYFRKDPNDELYLGGPDPDINPENKDNYLVAKEWFEAANSAEDNMRQHIMMRALFRSYPARSQFDYAQALQRDGLFDEVTRIAWKDAFDGWTEDYGRMEFQTPAGPLYLEVNDLDTELDAIAKKNGATKEFMANWLSRTQKVVNYRYWRTRALSESDPLTVKAHRELFDGERLFKEGRLSESEATLISGMETYEKVLDKYQTLMIEDLSIEEGIFAVMLLQKLKKLKGEELPERYPLKKLFAMHQNRVPYLQTEFRRRFLD
ncbi:MAG: hypothetical protein CMJ78_10725 [Planctomycetaceae bacterium]|nr:hypothetical protein [Planctomycetaceae bacterium]